MQLIQKLMRNGSSTVVTIPKPILAASEFLPGQQVIVQLLEDGSVLVRRPSVKDFPNQIPPRWLRAVDEAAKP